MCNCCVGRTQAQRESCLCPCHARNQVIGGTRAGRSYLAAVFAVQFFSPEAADRRYAEQVAREDAATAAEGRPAAVVAGKVLERRDAPSRRALEVVRAFRRERLRQGAAAIGSNPRWPYRPARRTTGAKNA